MSNLDLDKVQRDQEELVIAKQTEAQRNKDRLKASMSKEQIQSLLGIDFNKITQGQVREILAKNGFDTLGELKAKLKQATNQIQTANAGDWS